MRKYFTDFAVELGIPFDELFTFGQTRVNPNDPFSMTILALRLSRHANGVSKLHGEVSRGLWKDVWTGVPQNEVPITSVTNGVHTKTWMAPEFSALYEKYLGDRQLQARRSPVQRQRAVGTVAQRHDSAGPIHIRR